MDTASRVSTVGERTAPPAPPARKLRRTIAILALVGLGVILGSGGVLLIQEPDGSPATPAAAESRPASAVGGLTCTTYDVPGLEGSPIARSTLVNGFGYVLVCSDATGREVINEQFVFGGP